MRAAAGCGTTQPSSQARFTIATSICLIVTALPSLISSTHAASHGAGTEAAGELGEVVRAVQLLDRLVPAVAVDEVVPVRDQVAERAAAVAEGHAALHAARALLAQLAQRQRADELAQVADALARVALRRLLPADLDERPDPPHYAAASDSLVTNPTPPAETG